MGTRERRDRSDQIDREISSLYLDALAISGIPSDSIALAAVGGYGRGELSPGSDIDLLILHDGRSDESALKEFINATLYPLWNQSRAVDHSVRTRSETLTQAQTDIRVALGLLDIRYICGDRALVDGVASDCLDNWIRNFDKYRTALYASITEREGQSGELAYLLEPDLKEARGGLRDITALRAIVKSQSVEVAFDRVAVAESLLTTVRDCLHETSGRNRDQLLLTEQDAVAAALGYQDADVLMFEVAKAARSVDYVMDLTWHRINHSTKSGWFKRSKSVDIGKGLQESNNELVIESGFNIVGDPGLGLRAAAMSAQRGIPLSIEACMALAENFSDLPNPWPRQSREDLVALIGSGSAMVQVFEALDQEGIIGRWIPEWEHVRFLPQRNVLHHHTVDRHMLETAVKAAALTRQVRRPDLLLVGALFHDIGKGFLDKDHSDYGAELITPLAQRLGFPPKDVETLAWMVKQHLLLPSIATRRDLDDPQTIQAVLSLVPDPDSLELLHALSIADGEATGKSAWSAWKAGLVEDLVDRTLSAMKGAAPAKTLELTEAQLRKMKSGELSIEIRPREEAFEIEIISPDRMGLLSVVAGVLSISRMDLRSARTRTVDDVAVMTWLVALDVHAEAPQEEQLLRALQRALDGELDLNAKIDDRIRNYRRFPGIPVPPPLVTATNDIATDATILEVRMHDRPGVLYSVTKVISRFGVDIRAAIVATLGAEAFDTLYITDLHGGALSDERAKTLATQIERHLITQ